MKRIRTRLIALVLGTGLVAPLVVGWLGYSVGNETLSEAVFAQLTSVRASKADQVEALFRRIRSQVRTFSENRMVVDALQAFKTAFQELDQAEYEDEQRAEWSRSLSSYYEEQFVPRLNAGSGVSHTSDPFLPTDRGTSYLQYQYISANPSPVGAKDALTRAEDQHAYNALHATYHPVFRRFIEEFGYYDLFLVDDDTGHIVYSVFKEADFGTSLVNGPYNDTNFAAAFDAARTADDPSFARLVDFEAYDPSYAAAASFIASPVFDGDQRVGVLVFQLPVDEINRAPTGDGAWRQDGLGESGETYIVGSDYLMRSVSRFLREAPDDYFAALADLGVPAADLNRQRAVGTSILQQEVRTEAVTDALEGHAGTKITEDYRGPSVLSSYSPLEVEDVSWVLLSEIDEAEAFEPTRAFGRRLVLPGMLLSLLLLSVAVGLGLVMSRSLVRPLTDLMGAAKKVANGDLDTRVAVANRDEVGQLATTFNSMVAGIRERTDTIERNNREILEHSHQIQDKNRQILQLSTPVSQLSNDVLLLPVIGVLDAERADHIMRATLEAIAKTGATAFILEISGVGELDAEVAERLTSIATATKLMGCDCIVSGFSPALTLAVIESQADVSHLRTTGILSSSVTLAAQITKGADDGTVPRRTSGRVEGRRHGVSGANAAERIGKVSRVRSP